MKQISFKQYRSIDVAMLCAITAFFEFIVCLATNQWFVLQAMSVSITLAMTCITTFRWGKLAIIPSLVGSISYCIAYGSVSKTGLSFQQISAHCLGSAFCILAVPILEKLGKENLRKDFIKRSAFVTIVYILIAIGRCLISLLLGASINSLPAFFTVDILSLLFAIVVLTLVKDLDGVIEDQKAYILRLDRERREEEGAKNNDPFNDPY